MPALTSLQRKLISFPLSLGECVVFIGIPPVCLLLASILAVPIAGFGDAMLFLFWGGCIMLLLYFVMYKLIANDDQLLKEKAYRIGEKTSQLRSVAKRLKLKDDPVFMANIEANNIRRRCLEQMADLMREIKETKAVLRGARDEETKMFLKKAIAEKNAERDSLVARISNAQEIAEYAVANGHVWPPNDGMFHDYF